MTSKSRMFVAVAGALSMGAVATYAADAQPDRIAELEAKVAQLEARQATNSKDVASTIDSVLRDAERRSQLLQNTSNMGAGYDNGFFISAGEGWTLRPGAFFQFRNVTNWATEGDDDGGDDEIENGFEVRRMRLELNGTAFTRDLEYSFVWDSSRNGGGTSLLDAWVKYMFADDWGFRVGQFKDPVTHEKLVSSKRQLAADRTLLDATLGGGVYDRVQGVSLIYGGYSQNNPINVEVAFHDGPNSKNTDFQDVNDGPIWGVGGRFEYKAMGDWRAYRDFTAMGNKEDLLVIGVGGDWSQFETTTDVDNGAGNLLTGTIDAQWENAAGLAIYGAGIIQHRDEEFQGGDDNTDWGALAQVGYMLNPAWELFGRVSYTEFDEEVALGDSSEDAFWELTVGLNYYLGNNGSAGHRAKVTIDLTWLPDGAPSADTGLGYFGTGGDDEIVIRGQFQLLI